MDPQRFDAMTKTLVERPSRRTALRLLGGLGAAALTLAWRGPAAAEPPQRVAACQSLSRRAIGACMRGDCKAPGESCGVTKGDGIDHTCCSSICVGRGVCSAKSGCSNSGCGPEVECCYGYDCVGTNCVAF